MALQSRNLPLWNKRVEQCLSRGVQPDFKQDWKFHLAEQFTNPSLMPSCSFVILRSAVNFPKHRKEMKVKHNQVQNQSHNSKAETSQAVHPPRQGPIFNLTKFSFSYYGAFLYHLR